MFHQIIIRKSDQGALRFVWRKCPLKPIEDYVMCLHFFGKLDWPCVVNYTLKKTAIDHRAKYNHDIIDAVHMDDYMEFYIDDYLESYRNIDLAKETVVNVTKLLSEGEFRQTTWMFNSNSPLKVLSLSEAGKSSIEDSSMKNGTKNIPEIMWNYEKASLNVTCSNKSYPNIKKGILSHISSIFNPLGLLAPFLLRGHV